jgi:hypothetical protein
MVQDWAVADIIRKDSPLTSRLTCPQIKILGITCSSVLIGLDYVTST